MPNTSLGMERGGRFTIYKDSEGGCGDAGLDKRDEVVLEALSPEGCNNEVPLNSVKGFGKIKLEKEGFVFP